MYNDFVGGQVVLIELQGWGFPAATNAKTHGHRGVRQAVGRVPSVSAVSIRVGERGHLM